MKRVVITGSAGLIGGQLAYEIERRYPDAFVQRVDIKNGHDCKKFFLQNNDTDWDAAIHCAAITGGILGTVNNAAFQGANNSAMDGLYFDWALRVRPGRIVYISSSCAYPVDLSEDEEFPAYGLTESDIDLNGWYHNPDNVYGWAKLNGEVMANAVRAAGVPTSITRPFAIVGEGQENCRMIPAFVERAMGDDAEMVVWGPGTQASDFVHVSDAANAIIAMIEQGVDGPVNIATGRGASADEVAEMVMKEVGIKRPIIHDMNQPYGPPWRVGDPSLLNEFYTPSVTLEEIVSRVVRAHTGIPTSYGPGDDLA